eukprot:TRINITY_DN13135_c0_g1_i1.p1 TRINITY_DN13135_c0_g1~~TRINITY_DN13135_c0_g1_i1.p1  ORF type:complete len:530 (+),score=215.81 TRINITY_DN13135_c0_g1_i1:1357-2946(+)
MTYLVKVDKTWADGLVKVRVDRGITFEKFLDVVGDAVGMKVEKVKYLDEDGDKVLVSNQEQLDVVFDEFEDKKRFKVIVEEEQAVSHDELITEVLTEYRAYLEDRSKFHFGYPYNLHYDHQEIFDVMQYSINNLGDPFVESNYGVHSRKFELDVLAYFAEMWKIPEGSYWGYVTSCGTEGNLHSILCAREMHPTGILYASRDSHYSVFKACGFYRMEYRMINSTPTGEMDYEHLATELAKNKGRHAIVVANIGTTVKGAVDSVDSIVGKLQGTGYTEEEWFIHCDGALYALMLPFMREFEQVDFTKKIHSMCVSGHKFLGCPMPCGVVICRKENLTNVTQEVEYLNSVDTTIMGSRNGHAPIFLWYSLQKGGTESLKAKVKLCHANARLLYNLLRDRGVEAMLNERSTTVVFDRPPEPFVKHWQLACMGDIAHVVVMPNVTVEKIVQFVEELVEAREGTWVPYKKEAPPTCFGNVQPKAAGEKHIFHSVSFKKKRTPEQLNESFNKNPMKTKSPPPSPYVAYAKRPNAA